MSYFGMGRLAAVGFVVVVGAVSMVNRTVNYTPAKGNVDTIDRTCDFIETRTSMDGGRETREMKSVTESCNATDEFAELANAKKREKDIKGRAVVHVSYQAADGSWQTADLKFDGRDDEFYQLKAGDQIDILVSKDDPKKIMID